MKSHTHGLQGQCYLNHQEDASTMLQRMQYHADPMLYEPEVARAVLVICISELTISVGAQTWCRRTEQPFVSEGLPASC